MSDKPIIDEERKNSIVNLFNSGSEEDLNMAFQIVHQCDIVKSFPMILQIIAACPKEKYTMQTPFILSENFRKYVVDDLLVGNANLIPATHDLDFITDLWEKHHKLHIINEDIRMRKKLILAFKSDGIKNSFKPNLNPKKNVKK